MQSWRVTWWYIQAFWQKYRRLVFIGVALGVFLVWLFPLVIEYLPQFKPTRFIGRVGLFQWTELPLDIQHKMSVGLTTVDETGRPQPVLAERWSVEEDGRVFRFLIRDDLLWQDGKPFTPQDVEYNFADVQVVRTENEVVFRLKDAYSPFPVSVSQPLFRQVSERRFGFWRQTRIIGLGEYRIISLKQQAGYIRQLVLENNKERIVYRFYPSEADALVAFRHGHIDVLENMADVSGLLPEERQQLDIESNLNLRQYVTIVLNTSDPNLTREMRQALNYATQKPGPESEFLRALGPVPPTSWAYNATNEINPFSYDLEKALALYQQVNPGASLDITLDTAVSLLQQAQLVEQDWERLGQEAKNRCQQGQKGWLVDGASCDRWGINVQVRVASDLEQTQAVLVAREAPLDPDQYAWWHSTQQSNLSRYQNPRVDKILEDARKETDTQKRKVLYLELQRYLVEDVPAIFLYHLNEFTIQRPGLL